MSNFTKLRYTWLCKSLKECGSCEAFIFVSNVIFLLHLWRVKAVRAFLVFCINNKWKICWNCEAFSICLFVFHNIWKICWSCEAFPICIFVFFLQNIWKIWWTCEAFSFCLFVFQNISKLCGSRLFLFFISSSRKFTVDTGSGAAASKLPQPKIFPKQIGCGGKIFDQQKKYFTSKEKDPPTLYSPKWKYFVF